MSTPPLPGTIVIYGPHYQRSGFGLLARGWALALHMMGAKVRIVPVDCNDPTITGDEPIPMTGRRRRHRQRRCAGGRGDGARAAAGSHQLVSADGGQTVCNDLTLAPDGRESAAARTARIPYVQSRMAGMVT